MWTDTQGARCENHPERWQLHSYQERKGGNERQNEEGDNGCQSVEQKAKKDREVVGRDRSLIQGRLWRLGIEDRKEV